MKGHKISITPLAGFKGWLKLFVLTAALSVQVFSGGMISYGEVYFYEEDGEEEDDGIPIRRSSTQRRVQAENEPGSENGPGSETQADDRIETNSVILDEPLVNQVTLKEQYHEDYKVYEESLADLFFFYSNVGNGGITHESVYLDIPQNLSYTIELNGAAWDYIPGQPISNYGTYVVRLRGIEDTSLPLYEQKEYQAVFRFRIQEKPPEEETRESGEAAVEAGALAGASGGMEWRSYTYDGRPLQEDNESSREVFRVNGPADGTDGETEGETLFSEESKEESREETKGGEAAETADDRSQEDGGVSSDLFGESESAEDVSEEAENKDAENPEGIRTESEEENTRTSDIHTGFFPRTQSYDSGSRRYHVTFPDGLELVSNVPEGYIGPDAVEVSVSPAGREHLMLYRDDEPVDYVHGENLTEPGHYRLELNGQPWSCTIASYVNDTGVYAAPAGMHLTSAVCNGEPLTLASDRYLWLEEDGSYQFVLEGEDGSLLNTSLAKDSEPPQLEVRLKGGNASIQYLSEDIEEIRLEKDGEVVEGFSGYSISRPGDYCLTVRDKAGNESSSRFKLTYRINRYGIAAGVLAVLLVAAGVAFVIHTKRSVKIR